MSMALPLIWPGAYKFYLIGNTPAVSLTRDLPPDVPANILLLPCGDFRNVLYTVFCESSSMQRKLDFTCGDYDQGILARNVLLLTMIFDDVEQITIWNIYLHMYLDDNSHATLLSQCRKLLACSATLEDWHGSRYGAFLCVGTGHTLLELRRLWTYYVDSTFPVGSQRALSTRNMIDIGRKEIVEYNSNYKLVGLSARSSAGPLTLKASRVCTEVFNRYWRTGTTSSSATSGPPEDTPHANPTLLYTRRGEGFRLHHATDPLIPFHLAPLFGNRTDIPSTGDTVSAAQTELRDWCQAFRAQTSSSPSSVTVRLILGDAVYVAHALSTWNATGITAPIPVAPWTSTPLELSALEYRDRRAPTVFDVVDTSNLADNVEVLQILMFSIPLLSTSASWSGVLYTESLQEQLSGSASHLSSLLPADISIISLLLGLCPVDGLSGFMTACYVHEIMHGAAGDGSELYHHIFTWKRPYTSDSQAQVSCPTAPPCSLHIDPEQLASVLLNIYRRLFADEDPEYRLTHELGNDGRLTAKQQPSVERATRELFVLFLRLVRIRCPIPDTQWAPAIQLFIINIQGSPTVHDPAGAHFFGLYHQDLSAQLYRHQVYTYPKYLIPRRGVGTLSKWATLPPLLRIYLTVPRQSFAVLRRNLKVSPFLLCVFRNDSLECGFQSISATFGTIADKGTHTHPTTVIREAAGGLGADSNSSLVVSFVVPAWILADMACGPGPLLVDFCVKSGPDTAYKDAPAIVQRLDVYSAPLSDREHVHIVAEERQPPVVPASSSDPLVSKPCAELRIGTQAFVHADLNVSTIRVASLTARLLVQHAETKTAFANGALPNVTQISPFTIRVALDGRAQDLMYPLPVAGSQKKTRLARKSSYIEVVVPVATPFPKVWPMESNPFPVIRTDDTVFPWNLHRVHLSRMPTLDVTALSDPAAQRWFYPHISSQMSYREHKMLEQGKRDSLTVVKEVIRTIMRKCAKMNPGPPAARSKVFGLLDNATRAVDTVFFVDELRYDLACHTIVCDAFVLSLSAEMRSIVDPWFQEVLKEKIEAFHLSEGEIRTWKQLLPALVERCRATWRHTANCEYGRIPLEPETTSGDPLCSCGRGKDVDGMNKVATWRNLAPFVTRIALSPLFAVPYLETIQDREYIQRMFQTALASGVFGAPSGSGLPDWLGPRCAECSKPSDDLQKCARCKAVSYCSKGCQKAHWKKHKPTCVAPM